MHFIIVLFLAIIIYMLQLYFYKRDWAKGLSVDISYRREYACIGDQVELIETITNEKALPLPVLSVKFTSSKTFVYDDMNNAAISDHYYRNDIFSVSGNQKIVRKQVFTTTQRGFFVIPTIDLVATDLFMARNYARMYKNHAALYVYPKQLHINELLQFASAIALRVTNHAQTEDPLTFRSIRKYLPTDSRKDINWKATAKTGSLMVNTHFPAENGRIVLLLNLAPHVTQHSDRLAECCISTAATLLSQWNQNHLQFRLAVNMIDTSSQKLFISDWGFGDSHYKHLLEMLCRIDLKNEPASFLDFFEEACDQFQSNNEHTVYVIVSNNRKQALLDACSEKKSRGFLLCFLCPERKESMLPAPFVQYLEVNPDAI